MRFEIRNDRKKNLYLIKLFYFNGILLLRILKSLNIRTVDTIDKRMLYSKKRHRWHSVTHFTMIHFCLTLSNSKDVMSHCVTLCHTVSSMFLTGKHAKCRSVVSFMENNKNCSDTYPCMRFHTLTRIFHKWYNNRLCLSCALVFKCL